MGQSTGGPPAQSDDYFKQAEMTWELRDEEESGAQRARRRAIARRRLFAENARAAALLRGERKLGEK